MHLPEVQWRAIKDLKDQVQFLLKDEIATSLLDEDPVTRETLDLVTNHVLDSITSTSCKLDIVELDFVFNTCSSYEQFVGVLIGFFCLIFQSYLPTFIRNSRKYKFPSIYCVKKTSFTT